MSGRDLSLEHFIDVRDVERELLFGRLVLSRRRGSLVGLRRLGRLFVLRHLNLLDWPSTLASGDPGCQMRCRSSWTSFFQGMSTQSRRGVEETVCFSARTLPAVAINVALIAAVVAIRDRHGDGGAMGSDAEAGRTSEDREESRAVRGVITPVPASCRRAGAEETASAAIPRGSAPSAIAA